MKLEKYVLVLLLVICVLEMVEPAFCGITNEQVKAASKSFVSTMNDWTPAVIGGGLLVSGALLFTNNYKSGLSGIAATAFVYAAKTFTGTGEAMLISSVLS